MVNFAFPGGKGKAMIQDTGNRLVTAFQKQTEKIIYFCAAENVSPNLAVHEIRKSFKRIRALLLFFDENHGVFFQIYSQQFSELGRFLAPIRESFVNTQIFERLNLGDILIPERKLRAARELLLEKNKTILEKELIRGNGFSTLRTTVSNFEGQLENQQTGLLSSKQLHDQLTVSFLNGYQVYGEVVMLPGPEINHTLRKKLKRLWYQLDFVKFQHPRYFKLKSDQLNKITEQLGDDHDMYVFLNELKTGGYEFDSEELKILENQMEHQRELNMLKLNPRLKQFFNETPEMFNQKMQKIFKIQQQ